MTRRLAAAGMIALAGCAGGALPDDPTVPHDDPTPGAVMTEVPADTLLLVALPERGHSHRVTDDGRYLVAVSGGPEREQPPVSRSHQGAERLPEGALDRIRAVLDEVGFFSLPGELDPQLPDDPAGVVLPGGEPLEPEPVRFTAGDGTRIAEVTIRASLAAPATLGPLEPLYRILDDEAIGGWRDE